MRKPQHIAGIPDTERESADEGLDRLGGGNASCYLVTLEPPARRLVPRYGTPRLDPKVNARLKCV